jgi:hypothetical protein
VEQIFGRKMKNKRIGNLFAKLAAQEEQFFKDDFLSPVVKGKPVRVRLSSVILNLEIVRPKKFEGWGVFRPETTKTARFVREPTMAEKRRYLDLFPVLRLIVCSRNEHGQWYGVAANSSDTRFKISGRVPIRLAEEVQLFETIKTRFDGANCWFDESDMSASLKNAVVLREALANETDVTQVTNSGLTKEEKLAYVAAFIQEIENKKDRNEERIKLALSRAGAEYRSYIERGDTYTVEYVVDGQQHKSTVSKDTLDVQSAGICLSGYDRNFDLQSLVGVIREGQNRHGINRVGLDAPYYGYRMRAANETPDVDHGGDDNDYD